MKIHQFVHTLTFGDAISDEVRSIQRLLREDGIDSEIYAVHWHQMYEGKVRDYRQFEPDLAQSKAAGAETAVVLHYSIGSPMNGLYLSHDVRRVLIYHNLTPERWYEAYNSRVAADLKRGKEELPKIIAGTELCLSDSSFNEKDLLEMGAKQTLVLPLLVDLAKWSVPANAGIAGAVRARGGVNIMHVGRIAPNKCIEDIIKAFYFFHHKIDKNSHLWLVGSDIDTELYSFELRSLIRDLLLHNAVSFPGALADSEVKAIYENSQLYLCMSEHEGFCVPLIEAMYFGLPVIAFDSSAVPDTLGDGGMLIADKDPGRTAELMHQILSSPALYERLQSQGRKRVESFSEAVFRKNLRERLLQPLSQPRR